MAEINLWSRKVLLQLLFLLVFFYFHDRNWHGIKDTNWSSVGNPGITFHNKAVAFVDVLSNKMKKEVVERNKLSILFIDFHLKSSRGQL